MEKEIKFLMMMTVFLENPKDSHEKASYKRIWCVEYKINYRSNQSSSVHAKAPKKRNGKNILLRGQMLENNLV